VVQVRENTLFKQRRTLWRQW